MTTERILGLKDWVKMTKEMHPRVNTNWMKEGARADGYSEEEIKEGFEESRVTPDQPNTEYPEPDIPTECELAEIKCESIGKPEEYQ